MTFFYEKCSFKNLTKYFTQITSNAFFSDALQKQTAKHVKKSNFDTFSEKCVLPNFRDKDSLKKLFSLFPINLIIINLNLTISKQKLKQLFFRVKVSLLFTQPNTLKRLLIWSIFNDFYNKPIDFNRK